MNVTPFEKNREKIAPQKRSFAANPTTEAAKQTFEKMRALYESAEDLQVGKGLLVKEYLSTAELRVDPFELFPDMIDLSFHPKQIRKARARELAPKDKIGDLRSAGILFAGVDFGHTEPDWEKVFSLGFPGLLRQAQEALQRDGLTAEQRSFYRSVACAYEGAICYLHRLADLAKQTGTENSRFAAENLEALALHAPETLAQALQMYVSFYAVQHFADDGDVRSLGRLDEILYPYYRRHLEDGGTEEQVRQLLRYFLFKWSLMEIPANIPFRLSPVPNELTWLILQEHRALGICDPKIHIMCTENTPQELIYTVLESVRAGSSSYVFVNEKGVSQALVHNGVAPEHAENPSLVGCYEPAALGRELPCSCNGNVNLPMALESVLNGGKMLMTGKTVGREYSEEELASFPQLLQAVKEQLGLFTDIACEAVIAREKLYPQIGQAPVLSSTYESCMERGTDIYAGGAVYNSSSLSAIGIATAVDALAAIRKTVYEEKTVTLSQLRTALRENWQGHEALRQKMRRCPKFGCNDPVADELACDLTEYMASILNGRENGRGGVFRLGLFSIDWNIDYAKTLGASADGRFAGEPMSKNLSPSAGMDKKGVTGSILSARKLPQHKSPDGAVLDLALHPSAVQDEEGLLAAYALIRTYFAGGGLAVQFNIVDPATLRKAQQEPEKYRNLQVRLCGWNEYFTAMSPDAQEELIRHTEMLA